MSELLDVVDEQGQPTGQTIERTLAHAQGIWHRTSHVWILRHCEGTPQKDTAAEARTHEDENQSENSCNNQIQILLQKRSQDKDSFPGCYDISSAGHIPAGVDFVSSALRELEEELGVIAKPEQLIPCGDRKIVTDQVFHGQKFLDRQYTRVFCLWWEEEAAACPRQPSATGPCEAESSNRESGTSSFVLQRSEIDEVIWLDFQDCYNKVANNEIPHCIDLEELDMLLSTALPSHS